MRQLTDLEILLIEALTFYADPETYHGCLLSFDSPTGGFDTDIQDDHGHPDYDRPMPGARARAAIAAIQIDEGP